MKKLRENSGVTILMALLLLLMAAVVSAVILTAAASAAYHLKTDRAAQQDYLTVSSAAERIRDSILSDEYERVVEVETRTDADGNIHRSTNYNRLPEGLMSGWLNRGIGHDADGSGCKDTITVEVPLQNGEALTPVTAEFAMTGRDEGTGTYDITVTLSLQDGGTDGCRMTLTLRGNYEEKSKTRPSGEDGSVETTTTRIWWDLPKIKKGIQEAKS